MRSPRIPSPASRALSPHGPLRTRLRHQALLLVAASVLPYLGSLSGGFVYDDHALIEHGAATGEGRWLGSLTTGLWGELPAAGYYRPLLVLSFAADHRLGAGAPLPFHLTNMLLHSLLVLAAWWVLRLLTADPALSLSAAALFAVHPVHVEAVAWISGRGDLLAPALLFAAWGVWLAGGWLPAAAPGGDSRVTQPNRPGGLSLLTGAVLFLLALLSKESAVALPLMAAIGASAIPAATDRAAKRGAPLRFLWLATLAGAAIATWLSLRTLALGGVTGRFPPNPLENPAVGLAFTDRVATSAYAFAEALRLLVWPHPLRADYSVPVLRSVRMVSAEGLASVALLCTAIGLAIGILIARRSRSACGPALAIAAWVPVSGLLPGPGSLLAERYLVLPSFGFALATAGLAAWGARRLQMRSAGAAFRFLILVIAGLLAFTSARRVRVWHDDGTLIDTAVEPGVISYKVLFARGMTFYAAGLDRAAADQFTASIDSAPTFFQAWEGLGRAKLRLGDAGGAAAAARHALSLNPSGAPSRARCHLLLGEALVASGEDGAAEEQFRRASTLDPTSGAASRLLGDRLFARQRAAEAAAAYGEALARDPRDAVAAYNRGVVFLRLGRNEEAIESFEAALRGLDPPASAHFQLGDLLEKEGREEEAAREYRSFLAAGGSGAEPSMRQEAERRLRRLTAGPRSALSDPELPREERSTSRRGSSRAGSAGASPP